MRAHDSNASGFNAKAEADNPLYRERVAVPVMDAIDSMSKEWRSCVHRFGYVDVYRAWRRGLSVAEVERRAESHGGFFVL